MRSLRAPLVAALLAAAALAAAGTYTIKLVPFPTAEVADGRSQVSVSAQVFEDGHGAPDGTQVVFETNLGSFRESVVRTTNGYARATLVAGGVPGIAHVKATVSVGDATGSTCDIEFVKSREELSQARETIEATSTGSLIYANDRKVIEGVAPDKGVLVRYRDLEIHADVLQLDLNNYTIKARKATVRRGRRTVQYDSLFLDLSGNTGYGLTTYPATRPDTLVTYPGGVAFAETNADGEAAVAKTRMRFGLVEIGREKDRPLSVELGDDPFAMADLSTSPSTVGSRKAVVYARREIQFHRADIYVDNAKVLKFPLFVVNLNSSSGSPLVTDDILSVNDNQIALNYPHYLSLKPGLTSLLRFRTGTRYGQSLAGSRGAFLDYELAWSKGDDMQGGFTFSGMGRSDWVASAKQYWRLPGNTTANFQVDSPGAKGLLGSGSLTRPFGNFTLGLSGSQNQTWSGPRRSDQNYGLSFDHNPERIERTPVRFSYGLTATESRSVFPHLNDQNKIDGTDTFDRSGAGVSTRFYTDSIPVDKASSVNASFGATQLFGEQPYNNGLSLNGAISLTRRFNSSTSAFLTYNYLHDGISERFTGTHSLSLIGNFAQGNTSLRLSANKGLGVERASVAGEASYRFSSLWRVGYSHFLSQYAADSVTEYYYLLSYRIGWREVGLTWSNRTKRVGFQLMNVNF